MTVPSAAPLRRGLVLLAIAASAWGSGGAVAEILYRTSGLGPIAVCWWRLVVGATVLTVASRKLPGGADWRAALPIGIGLAVAQAAYFAAIADVGVAIATMVTLGAGPLLVAIGARFALGERLSPVGVVAVLVALGGLVSLTSGAAGPRPAVGVGLALLAATGQAATTVLSRRTGGHGADTTAACWIGAAVLTPLALVAGILPRYGVPVQTVGWLLYLGIVPTALAYRMFFAGIATVPATVASVITLLEPVAAAMIAVGLLGERLSGPVVIGAMVLLSAVTMISVTPGHPRK